MLCLSGAVCYALCPGYITSKNDGDLHYISAMQLAELYGVNIRKCIVVDFDRPETYMGRDLSKYIKLRPKYYGNYNLPNA